MDSNTRRLAWLLGLAGLLPFAACALAFFAAPEAWRGFAEGALIAYGAVILSFVCALHWGFAMALPGLDDARRVRTKIGRAHV